jgi:hypothetical protein
MLSFFAEDRDPAPIPQAAWERAEILLCIEVEQRNWSWLLNPRRSAKPPSLEEESSSDSEEEPIHTDEGTSVNPAAAGSASPSPIAFHVEEYVNDDDDRSTIGSLMRRSAAVVPETVGPAAKAPIGEKLASKSAPAASSGKKKKRDFTSL